MENKKNSLTMVLIVIIAILCLVVGWLLGSKFADKENEILDNPTTDTEEKEELNVVDYINKTFDKNTINKDFLAQYTVCDFLASEIELGVNEVRLPMIKSNKPGAQIFNDTIKNHYKDSLDELTEEGVKNSLESIAQEHPDVVDKFSSNILGSYNTINYEYKNSNGYISVLITSNGTSGCGTGGSYIDSYVYDIENDQYLTKEDVIKSLI